MVICFFSLSFFRYRLTDAAFSEKEKVKVFSLPSLMSIVCFRLARLSSFRSAYWRVKSPS